MVDMVNMDKKNFQKLSIVIHYKWRKILEIRYYLILPK